MKKTIFPCLWFDTEAHQAAAYYCSIIKSSKILEQSQVVTTFELNGTKFMALNGGPKYKINSAVSYFVYCNGDEEITRLYKELSKDGSILMPLDKYEWTEKYAWVVDKFGVNWQLDIDNINNPQKIVPALLFVNEKREQVKEAMDHYRQIFPNSMILMEMPHPATANLPEGTQLFAQYKLDGFIFNSMSSTLEYDYDFSPGNSFVVECDTQEQIDLYWEKLGEGGSYSMCGWLEDKFGVSWQIVPAILSELLADPERSQKVTEAFLEMQKFDIETLINA